LSLIEFKLGHLVDALTIEFGVLGWEGR
jgi:hypothetical protein